MAGDEPPTNVTQREFYSALTLVWTFIMLAFSTAVFSSASPNRSMVNVLYLAISLLMVVNYSVATWRGGGASRKGLTVALTLAAVALVVGAVAFFAR